MYSNNAYEALYTYLGLGFQQRVTEFLTSESTFKAAILMIFGLIFLATTARFFSRYLPHTWVHKKNVSITKFFKVLICLVVGMSILKLGTETSILNYGGTSWHDNRYVKRNMTSSPETYKVSFIFDVITRTSEELGARLSGLVDRVFAKTHSSLTSPDFFYKSILYAGTVTIDNSELKDQIVYYTEECLDQVLPMVKDERADSKVDGFFFRSSELDSKLDEIKIELQKVSSSDVQAQYTCLDLKDDLKENFLNYADSKSGSLYDRWSAFPTVSFEPETWRNLYASNLLVNHFLDQHEAMLGIEKGSQVPRTAGRVFQYLNRVTDFWDSALSVFGKEELHGASLSAKRAKEFSELLKRAPHLKGGIKLILITLFPFLVFFIVAGKFKWLYLWSAAYFSVCMWQPIWSFLYHLVTNLDLAMNSMEDFGRLYDGVSLYSSKVLGARIYYLYAVYSWAQIALGPGVTVAVLWFMKPLVSDSESESAPQAFSEGVDGAKTVASVATKLPIP